MTTPIPLITGPVKGDDVNRLINAVNVLVGTGQASDAAALALKANTADLATVATSGDYDDLINAPNLSSFLQYSAPDLGITATGTTRTGAYPITATINTITTCATGAGIVLPAATVVGKILSFAGLTVAADFPIVYAAGSNTINGVAGSTGSNAALGAGDGADLICDAAGSWVTYRTF